MNKTSEVKWGYRGFAGAPAASVHAELKTIEAKRGSLTAPIIVSESKRGPYPLLRKILWTQISDESAAYQWRLYMARLVVRSIEVVVVRGDESREIRAWPSVVAPEDPGLGAPSVYVQLGSLHKNAEDRQRVIAGALKELIGWKRRYSDYQWFLQKFAPVAKAIEKLEAPAG